MVSIAVCFKNEAEVLPLTIPTWQLFADEIAYLDTGSEDESLEIVLESARPRDKVFRAGWKDFATGINQSMDATTGFWAIRLDADEYLAGDPEGFRRWLTNMEAHPNHQRVNPSILMSLYEFQDKAKEWKLINWRARMFVWSDGWRFRFPIDALPVAPEGVKYGLLCPTELCSVFHLRDSVREESIVRNECYVWKRLLEAGGDLEPGELEHYETVLEICDIGDKRRKK
jgi:glycosyltransferase involved in cell wall biosynthesis